MIEYGEYRRAHNGVAVCNENVNVKQSDPNKSAPSLSIKGRAVGPDPVAEHDVFLERFGSFVVFYRDRADVERGLLDHRPDVSVLQDQSSGIILAHGNVHHSPSQIVSRNHQIGEDHPKGGVNRTQQSIAEIRFLSRLNGVNVGGSEDIGVWEPHCEKRVLSLPL
jgi:hypothetical protein